MSTERNEAYTPALPRVVAMAAHVDLTPAIDIYNVDPVRGSLQVIKELGRVGELHLPGIQEAVQQLSTEE